MRVLIQPSACASSDQPRCNDQQFDQAWKGEWIGGTTASSPGLAKDPARRYASAQDLRADLLRFRQGAPVQATLSPPPPPSFVAAATTSGAEPRR